MTTAPEKPQRLKKKVYERELLRLQAELVDMQEWVRTSDTRLGRGVRGPRRRR
jgi:polyphosphate kinase 2 (PPK2 family)